MPGEDSGAYREGCGQQLAGQIALLDLLQSTAAAAAPCPGWAQGEGGREHQGWKGGGFTSTRCGWTGVRAGLSLREVGEAVGAHPLL